eukprot:12876-Eustigmatos_ZCMA.PRE.1
MRERCCIGLRTGVQSEAALVARERARRRPIVQAVLCPPKDVPLLCYGILSLIGRGLARAE